MVTWNGSCAATYAEDHATDIHPGVSVHQIFIKVNVICTIIVCLSMGGLALTHIFNYTIPREQRFLLRVIALPPVYTICNLIGTIDYPTNIYLAQIPNLVEAFGLAAVFELYVNFLTPGATVLQRDQFFENLERTHIKTPFVCCFSKRNQRRKHDHGSLRWFKVIWALVFQYIPMSWVLAILSWIAGAMFCPYDGGIEIATIFLSVFSAVFISMSILAILTFELRLRGPLKPLGAGRKLWGLKLFVGAFVIIEIVVAVLQEVDTSHPHLTFYDLSIGVPNMLFELSMLIFCAVFWWAYPATRYRRAATVPDVTGSISPRQPAYRAIIDALNIWDTLKGVWYGLKVLALFPFGKKMVTYHAVGAGAEYAPVTKPGFPMETMGYEHV